MDNSNRELIEKGFTLVTATQRIASHLHYRYAREQSESGLTAWESPSILSWQVWLSRFWNEYTVAGHGDRVLLTAQQQLAVWQQLLSRSAQAKQLFNTMSAARRAVDAWTLCQQWLTPVFPEAAYLNEDARAFRSWVRDYEKLCRDNNWIDVAVLAGYLAENITAIGVAFDKKIALFGFDDFSPQQRAFITALKKSGCSIIEQVSVNRNRHVACSVFVDSRAEIRAAANWAREIIASAPAASIGIVVPDLPAQRKYIEDGFDDVLHPGSLLSAPDDTCRSFNISLGQPLTDYPVINTALLILGLGKQPLLLDELGTLLRTPYFRGAETEQFQRARLNVKLHDSGEQQLTLDSVLSIGGNHGTEARQCGIILDCLQEWQVSFRSLPNRQSAQQWIVSFSQLLKLSGWPGERTLDSVEYQAVEAWQELINQFVSLDLVSTRLDYSTALAQLRQMASAYSFQPQTVEVPIQVTGLAGTAGMQFDHLWIMDMQEEVWPPPARPNAFIPIDMQRETGMPDASADINLKYAKLMTERLVQSAREVVLSYPGNEKERILRPSPLLKDFANTSEVLHKEDKLDYVACIFTHRKVEYFIDDNASPVPAGQRISGGAALFRNIGACSFRAFARHRLQAGSMPEADIGLNAMQRGTLLHQVMNLFWQELASRQKLVAMDVDALVKVINAAVTRAVAASKKKHPHTFTERYTRLEQRRMKNLLLEWCEQERQRSDFVVSACEQENKLLIEGLEIHTRIDRIDLTAAGGKVIIDYKTGQAKTRDWFGDRPDDPQLPLYAITRTGTITSLAFAQVNRRKLGWIGLSAESGILPDTGAFSGSRYSGDIDTWPALLENWKQVLSALAIEFREGNARVNPKSIETCRYCDLHSLCRIYELQTHD